MGMRSRFSRDDGMTLVEVVVAAAILFIIMTGVLGLIGRTMQMGAQAKEINVSNNAVNSYVEWMRSLPFAEVVPSGGSVETTVVVNGEYTITIEPTVEAGENASLRNITLQVSVTRPDGFAESFHTSTVIRDRDQHLTESSRSPSTDPTIQYVGSTPPDGEVVWYASGGSWWEDSVGAIRPVQFQVKAKASTGRTLQLVTLQGQESWTLEDAFGQFATWSDPAWSLSPVFSWDLNQATTIGELQVSEGKNDVWAYATDSAGARSWDMRVYLLDNVAPGKPSAVTFVPGGISGTLQWPVTQDGNQYADRYRLQVLRHDTYGTWPDWPVVIDADYGTNSTAAPAAPFSRYVARVQAVSPRGLTLGYTDYVSFVTRPRISGTYSLSIGGGGKKWTVSSVSLAATPPAFPHDTAAVTYQWYTVTGGTETLISGASSATLTSTGYTLANYPTTPAIGYRCKVTVTALGMYAPSVAVTYVSNTVYPEAPAGTAKAFGEGTW